MIASIHGTLEARRADHAIVRVGGFSLRIFAPASTLSRLGEPGSEVTLYTHFQVREDGMALFGFSAESERDAFEQLISISGVGPKVALALLGTMDAQVLYRAIADEDLQRPVIGIAVHPVTAGLLVTSSKRDEILVGDVILTIDGGDAQSPSDLERIIRALEIGKEIEIGLTRGGEPRTVRVRIRSR